MSDGVEGFGLATNYTDISPIAKVVKDGLADEILGMDALAPETLYQKLFGLTSNRRAAENGWGRGIDPNFFRGRPRLLGHHRQDGGHSALPAVRRLSQPSALLRHLRLLPDGKDNAELRDEIQMLVEQGHRGFKGSRRLTWLRHRAHGNSARRHRSGSRLDDRRKSRLGSEYRDRGGASARGSESRMAGGTRPVDGRSS